MMRTLTIVYQEYWKHQYHDTILFYRISGPPHLEEEPATDASTENNVLSYK
jgi:hypothetical protein